MKKFLLLIILVAGFNAAAQDDCQYTILTNQDGKEYKSTKEYVMYENVFGGSSSFVFLSLSIPNEIPVLNFQLVAKSQDFPKAYCIDKNSKIYLQLSNGKIVTLITIFDEQCSKLVYDAESKNNIRILSGTFLFTKGSMEDLEKYPVTLMRVRYSTETVDYPIRKEVVSETNNVKYFPEAYFMNYLKCLK